MTSTENPTHCPWMFGGQAYFNMGLWSKGEGNGKWNTTLDLNLLPDKSPEKCNESKTKFLKGSIVYVVQKSTTLTGNQLMLWWPHSHAYSKTHADIFSVSSMLLVSKICSEFQHAEKWTHAVLKDLYYFRGICALVWTWNSHENG